jgi:hypothetical protein
MNPNTIYSKSGKGVQEASGKTSLLKRGDRAVLSAIDGRTTLAEVAQKVGKEFDASFQQLISQLDKDGFVREVTSAPSSAASGSRPGIAVRAPSPKAPAAKGPPVPAEPAGGDLDFTSIMPAVRRGQPAAKPPPSDDTAKRAKEQEAALHKARQEAEARAQAEREKTRGEMEAKVRAEAEAKIRAETEKKIRAEAEAKLKAEAEAKAKAAREAAVRLAAEAKAKAEAEAKAKIEAERKAREEAERKAREEAEKAKREAEELRQRLEEERRAREAEEQRRREEEERRRREEEERRAREEAERKAREAEEQRRRQEEEERRAREEIERMVREAAEAKRREEEERLLREREERPRRAREEEEERARRVLEETKTREPTVFAPPPAPEPQPPAAKSGGPGSLDSLMADLDSFSRREEEERGARDAAERNTREEKKRRAREESERRAREQADHERREAEQRRRHQEEERRAQEEAERRVREVEEQRRRESEERKRREFEAMAAAQQAAAKAEAPKHDIPVTEDDLDMTDVRRDQAAVAKDSRKAQREREREARQREREARERAAAAAESAAAVRYSKPRRPVKWGRPVSMTFFVLLLVGIGALHVMPLPMADYEDAASEALGRPVKIGAGRLSLFTGVRLNLDNVRIGDTAKIASVRAYPRIGSLIDEKKAFRRIELDGVTITQQSLGETLVARIKGDNFSVGRILVTQLKLEGPVPLPPLEADAVLSPEGALRSVTLRGPDNLNVKLTPASTQIEFDATASSFTVPFAPELTLNSFAMKGTATRQGMNIVSWGGGLLDGALSGTANVRWAGSWQVDGVMTARAINAAIFAPALLSEGKAEGTAKFSMSGANPAKLSNGARMEGNFHVNKGVLGSFDLSRAIQTSGRQFTGRTQFTEMTGQGVYDRGAVALRNVSISAGALGAGASADIAASGALSGRIIADMRTAGHSMRQTLNLGGTLKEPQVRN